MLQRPSSPWNRLNRHTHRHKGSKNSCFVFSKQKTTAVSPAPAQVVPSRLCYNWQKQVVSVTLTIVLCITLLLPHCRFLHFSLMHFISSFRHSDNNTPQLLPFHSSSSKFLPIHKPSFFMYHFSSFFTSPINHLCICVPHPFCHPHPIKCKKPNLCTFFSLFFSSSKEKPDSHCLTDFIAFFPPHQPQITNNGKRPESTIKGKVNDHQGAGSPA